MRETLVKAEEFRDSPLGRIPKDWEVKSLASITSKIIDGTHFTPTYVEDGVPFLRVTDIQSNTIDFDNVKRIPLQEHRLLTARCNPQIGDILYSKNGTVGITKLVNWHQEFSIFVSLCLIRPITTLVNPLFLAKILQSFLIEQQIRVRSKQMTVINLHLEEIREFFIPLPKLNEQDRIVKILDTVDDAIAHTSSLIAKLKQMKAGLLHDLLTRGLDENGELRDACCYAVPGGSAHPELFKDSPLGQIPKDWEVATIGEACSLVKDGSHLPPKRVENGPLLLSVQNVINGRLQWTDSDTRISWDFYKSMHRNWEIQVGDVLLTIIGTIGRTAIVPPMPPFTLQRNVAVLRGKKSILDNLFLHHYLVSDFFQKIVVGRGNQTAQPAIFLSDLNLLKIPLPSLKEQKKIATVVKEYNTRIRTEEAYRDKLKLQKQGLMHDLLTGKVRVKDTDKFTAIE